ncbi:MAG: patatin family protein, partial [Erysipelotrichaceae bacterium]|nr:patatin family protein [Erysipelotrichaceae bacterium]
GGAGISAGAVFGCNYKSKQIGRPLRYNTRFCRDWRYCSLRSLITTGDLYGADFCYRIVPYELDVFDRKTFSENPMEFYIGATDVDTGECIYHRCEKGELEDDLWMRASASMPLVSRIVETDGYKLLDGGIANSIPYHYMKQIGYERDVVILTQPLGFVKKKNSLMPLMKILYRKYPKLLETMANRHIRYNEETAEIRKDELAGKILVIRPPEPLNIGKTEKDPDELRRVYEIGRKEAEKRLEEIKKFLK